MLSELTSKTLPDGTLTESRTYDSNGNLSTVTHFNGAVTTYTYDALNRLLSRSTPGETAVSFTYTPSGKRSTMTDASGTTTYTYDSMDRLSSKATPEGTLSYTYDAAGNLASMQSADGAVNVSYIWNSLNLLQQVADSRLGTTSYQYDPANNLSTMTYPNQVQSTFTYDKLDRVTSLASGSSVYAYLRGLTGNLTSSLESSNRSTTWSFDGIYRLTGETISNDPARNNGSISYSLDPVGNRLSDSSSLPDISSGTWSYNADDQLSSETYDSNGNVTSSGGKQFTYDSQNHLLSMAATGKSVSIVYDGDGNRVSKTVNGATTQYLVDDLNPTGYAQVVEELTNGSASRTYTYGLQRISEYQLVNGAWTPSFYGYDGGGNVRNLTNSGGAVTDTYEYDAFGNSLTTSGSTPNHMLYQGEEWDPDLSLYYLRARYMNPLTGRFVSRDPDDGIDTDPASLHKYLYAEGDPVNLRDPNGREAIAATAEIDFGESIKAGVAATAVAVAVTCALDLSATTLEGITENIGYGMTFERTSACTEEVKSCKTEYPDYLYISRVPGDYVFESEDEAFADLQAAEAPKQLRKTKRAPALTGPCPEEGPYVPGWHVNVKYGSGNGYAGSLVGCPVCDDTHGPPYITQRWGVK